jgi:hypothetical protein
MWEWRLRRRKCGEELRESDVWASPKVAQRGLTLGGTEVEEDFILLGGGSVLGEEA